MKENTLLHRQVHPNFIQNNKFSVQVFESDNNVPTITSSVFVPKKSDEGELSVYNGDKFSAEESHNHYVKELESAGVVSVTIAECKAIDLSAVEDNKPYDGHSFIDFKKLPTSQIKIKAKILKSKAATRDWTYKI
jgi:hypothetical protein